MQSLLEEIEKEGHATPERRSAWSLLKAKLQAMLRLADVACENIAANPENHIFKNPRFSGTPAASEEQQQKHQEQIELHET